MARPLSEEKRAAIMAAAIDLIAVHGVGASTAKIAKAAGVSEGTLFTYFSTKDALLNQLLLKIKLEITDTMALSFPADGTPRQRFKHFLDKTIDWGLTNSKKFRTLRQLNISDRISSESRLRCAAIVGDTVDLVRQGLAGRIEPETARFYIGPVLDALIDVTIEAISASPKNSCRLKGAGFDMFWNGLQG